MGSLLTLAFLAALGATALRFAQGAKPQLKPVPVRASRRRP